MKDAGLTVTRRVLQGTQFERRVDIALEDAPGLPAAKPRGPLHRVYPGAARVTALATAR